ncbi:Haloacid dehalogenase-like hydrolase (HAD) superfamily protein [Hibiscus syriacus]|uniref:Haloacid dehalogenase-like hydrolase (HAD) superfamily protein n=1 Tax=Hibiscus syriacus TaxID=106335 RepID=A0A6A3ARM3_HIBSY|nr:Haloacid dehalogenase-like hydrolase (HAD) superfamily protein [Hibiscus syriacus]
MVAIALADMHGCGPKKKELKRETFMETNKNGNFIDTDRKGFETWKNMCEEERKTYVTQAEKVDDESDSATVGKFDQFNEDFELYETSDDGEPYHSGGFKSLNTSEWETAMDD